MTSKIINLKSGKVKVEANASTLLIYEDRFKGRRLLQDIDKLSELRKAEDIPFSLYTKLLWATAKTADHNIEDVYEWSKQFSIEEIIKAGQVAISLIWESISPTKKQKATVKEKAIRLLLKFFPLQRKAD